MKKTVVVSQEITIHQCDRCGVEQSSTTWLPQIRFLVDGDAELHVCTECMKAVIAFVQAGTP
jgi:ribosomal protein L37AE/L43A